MASLSKLRMAFDGKYEVTFGNFIDRLYRLRFTMLIGAVPKIQAYPEASMGDRFLKLHMRRLSQEQENARLWKAMDSDSGEDDLEQIQDLTAAFLAKKVKAFPEAPHWMKARIAKMSQVVSRLRIHVDRSFRGDIEFKPEPELGVRLCKQLLKLARSLAIVDGVKVPGWEQYRLIERVALDTTAPFHLEVLRFMMDHDGEAARREISQACNMPGATTERTLENLVLLGMIEATDREKRIGVRGRASRVFEIRPWVRELWAACRVGIPPTFRKKRRQT
jgi:hypothetical protein